MKKSGLQGTSATSLRPKPLHDGPTIMMARAECKGFEIAYACAGMWGALFNLVFFPTRPGQPGATLSFYTAIDCQ